MSLWIFPPCLLVHPTCRNCRVRACHYSISDLCIRLCAIEVTHTKTIVFILHMKFFSLVCIPVNKTRQVSQVRNIIYRLKKKRNSTWPNHLHCIISVIVRNWVTIKFLFYKNFTLGKLRCSKVGTAEYIWGTPYHRFNGDTRDSCTGSACPTDPREPCEPIEILPEQVKSLRETWHLLVPQLKFPPGFGK